MLSARAPRQRHRIVRAYGTVHVYRATKEAWAARNRCGAANLEEMEKAASEALEALRAAVDAHWLWANHVR